MSLKKQLCLILLTSFYSSLGLLVYPGCSCAAVFSTIKSQIYFIYLKKKFMSRLFTKMADYDCSHQTTGHSLLVWIQAGQIGNPLHTGVFFGTVTYLFCCYCNHARLAPATREIYSTTETDHTEMDLLASLARQAGDLTPGSTRPQPAKLTLLLLERVQGMNA